VEPLTTGHPEVPLVLRTDFTDPAAWTAITAAITAVGTGERAGFAANVELRDDPAYDGAGPQDVLLLAADGYAPRLIVLVDRVAVTTPDHPVLVVAVHDEERGETFRALPDQIQSVENNLSLYNMDWHEFAGAVDSEGVFRGF
jgi:hypothetical protein